MSPRFCIVVLHNPNGVTDCRAAPYDVGINVLPPMLCRPYGANILGDTIFHGGNTPAYALSPRGLIICRGQAHKEPVPEWLPPFREKLRVGSLIADLIRNLLRKMKNTEIPGYGDNINKPLSLCASVLKSQWGWGGA